MPAFAKYIGKDIKKVGFSRAEKSLPWLQILRDDVLSFGLEEASVHKVESISSDNLPLTKVLGSMWRFLGSVYSGSESNFAQF